MLKTKIQGFTLAEVLITLVIIGVIAALTIPNLLQKYQEQTTVKKVQKFYSTLSNAYNLAMKDNGTVSEWGLTGYNTESAKKIYEIFFKPYFKIAKNCGVDNTGNCVTSSIVKSLNNTNAHRLDSNTNTYKLTLDDGTSIVTDTSSGKSIFVLYDMNGLKGPNQYGIDLFYFLILGDKALPLGIPQGAFSSTYTFDTYCQKNATGLYAGYGCAAWIVYKGNMDYLHCDGLTWNSRSCKEK